MATLVEKVRWMAYDRPPRSRITNAGGMNNTDVTTVVTLPAGDVARLGLRADMRVEADDDTEESMRIDSTDAENEQITLRRGQDGTAKSAHVQNVALLFEPRFSYVQIADAAQDIFLTEFWPWVWLFAETTLAYETDGTYSPTPTDIEEVVYVYQLVAGEKFPLAFEWISPEAADATNFPRGMLVVPYPADTSTIYVAYKALLTLANAPERALRLASEGTAAKLMMREEMALVGPDSGKVAGGLQEGSRFRAGAALWGQFERKRTLEMVNLSQDLP